MKRRRNTKRIPKDDHPPRPPRPAALPQEALSPPLVVGALLTSGIADVSRDSGLLTPILEGIVVDKRCNLAEIVSCFVRGSDDFALVRGSAALFDLPESVLVQRLSTTIQGRVAESGIVLVDSTIHENNATFGSGVSLADVVHEQIQHADEVRNGGGSGSSSSGHQGGSSSGGHVGGSGSLAPDPKETTLGRRADFFRGLRLGVGDEWKLGVKVYIKSAFLCWKSQPKMIAELVRACQPVVTTTHMEFDTVDRTGRVRGGWNSRHKGRTYCRDTSCKAMLFYGRMALYLPETQKVRNKQRNVRMTIPLVTPPVQLPSLGDNSYGDRDKGEDLYHMVMNAVPDWESHFHSTTELPVRIELWNGDAHGTNQNTFFLGLREALWSGKEKWMRWVRNCLTHGAATASLEGNCIVLTFSDCSATAWQKRLYLTGVFIGGQTGRVHYDMQKLMDNGSLLQKRDRADIPPECIGGLALLLKFCEVKDVDVWRFWELDQNGVLFLNWEEWEDHNDLVLNNERWRALRYKQEQELHGLLSRPKAGVENKWFTCRATCLKLLLYNSIEYNKIFGKIAHPDSAWIGAFYDLSDYAKDADKFSTSMLSSSYFSGPFEIFQKRVLVAKHSVHSYTTQSAADKLHLDVSDALTKLGTDFYRLARICTPMTSSEDEGIKTAKIKTAADGVRWAIICVETTIIGRTIPTKGSHEQFLQQYEALSWTDPGGDERKQLVDFILELHEDAPLEGTWDSSDFGPLCLHQLAKVCNSYPEDQRHDVCDRIVFALNQEEAHSQPVEHAHQLFLAEVVNGGRMGANRGGARCSAAMAQRVLQNSLKDAESRLARMQGAEKLLHADVNRLMKAAGERAGNNKQLVAYNIFKNELSVKGELEDMSNEEQIAHVSTKWAGEDKDYWAERERVAQEEAYKTAAEVAELSYLARRNGETRASGTGRQEEVYVPPRWQKKIVEHFRNFRPTVEAAWDDKDVKDRDEAVKLWTRLTERDQSTVPRSLAPLLLQTTGPTLCTRRIVWMGQRLAKSGVDLLWRREATQRGAGKKKDDADEAKTEAGESSGLSTCPPPHPEATHLLVHFPTTLSVSSFENPLGSTPETVLVTFSWSRPFSWVGRAVSPAPQPAGASSSSSAAAPAPPQLPTANSTFHLPKVPHKSTIRSWLTSARRPRDHHIFECRLEFVPDGAGCSNIDVVVTQEVKFKEVTSIKDVAETNTRELCNNAGHRREGVVKRKRVEIEKPPTLKREKLDAASLPAGAAVKPPQLKVKKADSVADEALRVGGTSQKLLLNEAQAFSKTNTLSPQTFSQNKKNVAANEFADPYDDLDDLLADDLPEKQPKKSSPGGAASSSAAPSAPAGAAASAAARGAAASGSKKQYHYVASGDSVLLEDYQDIADRISSLATVGGGRFAPCSKKHWVDGDDGKKTTKRVEKRLHIVLDGDLKSKFLKLRDLRLKYFSKHIAEAAEGPTAWPTNPSKYKATSFGDVAAAFLRTWVRFVDAVVSASSDFIEAPQEFAVLDEAEMKSAAADAREHLLEYESEDLDSEKQEQLAKECEPFFHVSNFVSCRGFTAASLQTAFIDELEG